MTKAEVPERLEKFDKATRFIWKLLRNLRIGFLANIYINNPMLYNFMLVGASGVCLSWILFSAVFRPLFIPVPVIGEFVAYVVTTLCVFMWNFVWNRKWALNIKAQLIKLERKDLVEAQEVIFDLLNEKTNDEEKNSTPMT